MQTVSLYQGTRILGSFELGAEPETKEITARIAPGEELVLYFPSMRDWNPKWKKPEDAYRGPAVALEWFEIEGPEETGDTPETDGSLLDNTMVMYGSHMGDANRHTNTNLPVMLAGGGFRHGGHHVFDKDRNAPLANLFVSMLQRMGLETETFATGTGRLTGLEV